MGFGYMLFYLCLCGLLVRYWFVWIPLTIAAGILVYSGNWLGTAVIAGEAAAIIGIAWAASSEVGK